MGLAVDRTALTVGRTGLDVACVLLANAPSQPATMLAKATIARIFNINSGLPLDATLPISWTRLASNYKYIAKYYLLLVVTSNVGSSLHLPSAPMWQINSPHSVVINATIHSPLPAPPTLPCPQTADLTTPYRPRASPSRSALSAQPTRALYG